MGCNKSLQKQVSALLKMIFKINEEKKKEKKVKYAE